VLDQWSKRETASCAQRGEKAQDVLFHHPVRGAGWRLPDGAARPLSGRRQDRGSESARGAGGRCAGCANTRWSRCSASSFPYTGPTWRSVRLFLPSAGLTPDTCSRSRGPEVGRCASPTVRKRCTGARSRGARSGDTRTNSGAACLTPTEVFVGMDW